jgi:hypothetical protein
MCLSRSFRPQLWPRRCIVLDLAPKLRYKHSRRIPPILPRKPNPQPKRTFPTPSNINLRTRNIELRIIRLVRSMQRQQEVQQEDES